MDIKSIVQGSVACFIYCGHAHREKGLHISEILPTGPGVRLLSLTACLLIIRGMIFEQYYTHLV